VTAVEQPDQHSEATAGPPTAPDSPGLAAQLAEQLRSVTACMAEAERLQVYRAAARLLEPAEWPVDRHQT
jgi:hypothetical protein